MFIVQKKHIFFFPPLSLCSRQTRWPNSESIISPSSLVWLHQKKCFFEKMYPCSSSSSGHQRSDDISIWVRLPLLDWATTQRTRTAQWKKLLNTIEISSSYLTRWSIHACIRRITIRSDSFFFLCLSFTLTSSSKRVRKKQSSRVQWCMNQEVSNDKKICIARWHSKAIAISTFTNSEMNRLRSRAHWLDTMCADTWVIHRGWIEHNSSYSLESLSSNPTLEM